MPDDFETLEPEGSLEEATGGSHSGYFTKKDLRSVAIALVVVFILMIPIYIVLKRQSQKAACSLNCKAIQGAMLLYMEVWDNQFPPAYAKGDNDEPVLLNGKPFTWGTTIHEYLGKRASLQCPAADDAEVVRSYHPNDSKKDLPMTYGMYLPRSTAAISNLSDPAQSALVAETSNFGAQGTFNPKPYKRLDGTVVKADGFVIGWDTGNEVDWYGTSMADAMPTAVTRLAYYGTQNGQFSTDGRSRHDKGIHLLFADGHVDLLPPTAAIARYMDVGGDLGGLWSTR